MQAKGRAFKYGDNVDTDVIIPARYLNSSDPAELATHCMEDIDNTFVKRVQKGDIIVATKNFGCGSSREHAPIAIKAAGVSCVIAETTLHKLSKLPESEQYWQSLLQEYFTEMQSTLDFRSLSARKQARVLMRVMR